MDGDRQLIQADSDMSVELILVSLYISIMAGVDSGGCVCVHGHAAEADRARWTHPRLGTHKPADEIISL